MGDQEGSLLCSVCQTPSKFRCGGCQKAGYCSKEHQKNHWKTHKGECCAWKVVENAELGRHLVAVRDIKQGEIVLQEKPLLITPPKITLPVCLGCYSEFRADGADTDDGTGVKPRECLNKCGWPMCRAASCANSKEHEAECKFARDRGRVIIRNADTEHPIYTSIGVLRVLGMKETNPEAFEKIMSLESHVEARKDYNAAMERECGPGSSQGIHELNTAEACCKLIQEFFNQKHVSQDWIIKLIGIIETNGHEIPIPDKENGHINRRIIGVYHIASFLEHNCSPNSTKTWNLSTKEIIVRATLPIKKGQHISINYVDPLWGTNDRINLLRATKFFECRCDRCKDPTELRTHISSLRCQHLKCMNMSPPGLLQLPTKGMIVPTNPYKVEEDWKCNSCGEFYNINYAGSLLHKAGQELEELAEKAGDIQAKEDFIKRFSKTLSPTHYILLELKVELAQLYGRTQDEPLQLLPPKKLLRKIQLCEELVIILNVITPGYNRLRALILYELQAAVFTLSRLRRSVGEISLEKHLDELMQCGKWMTEVIKVLGWESEHSIERRRAAGAERDLELLRKAVLTLQESPDSEEALRTPGQSSGSQASPQETKKKNKDKKKDEATPSRSHLSVDEESFIEEVF